LPSDWSAVVRHDSNPESLSSVSRIISWNPENCWDIFSNWEDRSSTDCAISIWNFVGFFFGARVALDQHDPVLVPLFFWPTQQTSARTYGFISSPPKDEERRSPAVGDDSRDPGKKNAR
jgi:hypothetical protein